MPKTGPLAGGSEWPGVQRARIEGILAGETPARARVEAEPRTVEGQEDRGPPTTIRVRARGSGNPHKLSGEQLAE